MKRRNRTKDHRKAAVSIRKKYTKYNLYSLSTQNKMGVDKRIAINPLSKTMAKGEKKFKRWTENRGKIVSLLLSLNY